MVFDAGGLAAVTGMPVLGVVTRIKSAREEGLRRRALAGFLVASASWVALWGGLIGLLFATARSA